jgi:hypothetical protein
MGAVMEAWKAHARELRQAGLSERTIAAEVGKSPSSVHEAVKDVVPEDAVQEGAAEFAAGEQPLNGHGDPAHLAALAGDSSGGPTPGQLDIDGGETPDAPQPPVEEIILRGSTPLDFFNAGGKLPNKATIKFVGGKVGLEQGTAFKKGEVVHFTGYATVVAAAVRDKRDRQTGVVLESELQLHAEIDDLQLKGDRD